ncbi:MAG TPA: M1 family aminopeptidase [Candidatus Aminicenantes bacterium]|nr:M1 family aminopeptidase [Candidatus Aminicenantes bacterium]HRY65840.1 M1 family aminopeptidase [Candidatus Aminicenantes bacterium]HRZ72834.1 M1 family aminopeptidase [Candidatus Aminicenantes bacterium]
MKRNIGFLCLVAILAVASNGAGRPVAAETAPGSQPDITHFGLSIRIDEKAAAIDGIEEISYTASGEALDTFVFGQRDLKIVKVEAEPSRLKDFLVEKDSLRVRLKGAARGTPGRFRIHYAARPKTGMYFHRTVTETGVPVEQVWQFEGWEHWMPRLFDPDQRLTWDLTASVNPAWQVVSNGQLAGDRAVGDRREFHWRQAVPARFEGFTLAAGAFDVFKQVVNGRLIAHYAPAGVTTASVVSASLGRVGEMCEFFSREFGYPYPFGDYRQIIIWDYLPWGSEHLGLTCLNEIKLIDEAARLDMDDYIVAHELAHTWWAMLIAPKSNRHVWLNEAFGVYFGNQWFEQAAGRDEFEYKLRQRMRFYFDEDRRYRRVILSDEPVPGGLDEHIYSKGAYILHMLRSWLGDATFFAGLKKYAEATAFGEAESADLQKAMEEVSGQSLGWYFSQWLDRKGFPVLEVEHGWDEGTGRLTVRVTQAQDAAAGLYRLPAVVQVVTDAGPENHREVFRERTEVRTYELKKKPRYVRFNADNSLLAVIGHPRTEAELIEQLDWAADAQGRIEAVEALAAAPGERVVEALAGALRSDLFHAVRSAAATALAKAGGSSRPLLLEALSREQDPRVLTALIAALEALPADPGTIAALKRAASVPESPYVRGRALLALARSRAADAFEMLTVRLGENSHRDVLRASAFQGFEILKDPRAVSAILGYLRSDRTTRWAREPAVKALGALAGQDDEACRLLEEIAGTDFWPGVRSAARQALGPAPAEKGKGS